MMRRVSIRLTDEQLDRLERLVDSGVYPSRSELIRAAVRDQLGEDDAVRQLREQQRSEKSPDGVLGD